MAEPIVINNVYQVAIEATSGGQPVVTVIGIRSAFSNASEVANAVKAAWEDASGPCKTRTSSYVMERYRVTDLSSAQGDVFVLNSATAGGMAGALATNGSAALISYSGGTRSRSSSGRMYHGPLTETEVDPDGRTLNLTRRNALSAVYTLFKSNLQAAGFEWVVISRKLQVAFPVGNPLAQSIIGTQRRRIRGR